MAGAFTLPIDSGNYKIIGDEQDERALCAPGRTRIP